MNRCGSILPPGYSFRHRDYTMSYLAGLNPADTRIHVTYTHGGSPEGITIQHARACAPSGGVGQGREWREKLLWRVSEALRMVMHLQWYAKQIIKP